MDTERKMKTTKRQIDKSALLRHPRFGGGYQPISENPRGRPPPDAQTGETNDNT